MPPNSYSVTSPATRATTYSSFANFSIWNETQTNGKSNGSSPYWRVNSVSPTDGLATNYYPSYSSANSTGSSARGLSKDSSPNSSREQITGKYRYNNSDRYDTEPQVQKLDRELAQLRESNIKVTNGSNKYVITVDMHIFKPEDIEVLMEKGRLTVQAEHEVKLKDNMSVIRKFVRRIAIPDDVGTDMVATELSRSGMLSITALKTKKSSYS
ncbi:hsp20/alpha crystallin family domain-containing protein [Ditylenchus destructor]|nr:hsp20/alpha crystallin family domain-containing protein [Ditylenchus destructor]